MVDSCAERDSLEDGGEITRFRLEDGCHTFGPSIFDGAAITRTTYTILQVANVLVALNSMFCCLQMQRERYEMWVSNACSDSC